MPREIIRQGNFTAGELDPHLKGRRDLKPYFAGLAEAANILPMPQGPARRRPGSEHCGFVREKLVAVPVEPEQVSMPNGGSGGDLIAGNATATITGMGTIDPYVVVEIDFGEPTEVAVVDLENFALVPQGFDPDTDIPPPVAPPQYPWEILPPFDQIGPLP